RQVRAAHRRRLHRDLGGTRADRRLLPVLSRDALVHRARQREARAHEGDPVMKKILAILLLVPALARAEEGGPSLDRAPVDPHNKASLQHGAQIFVNNCLNCHTASLMRYGRLADLGLTEDQIKGNLLFGEKIGDSMAPPQDPAISKAAFGVVPPDLSLVARSRSPD